MKQEVLFIVLNEYADWENAFVVASFHSGLISGNEIKYVVKTVAPTLDPVCSLDGFRTLPDCSSDNLPFDCIALILIGGMQWQPPETERIFPIVQNAFEEGKMVGGICNAALFLYAHGFLNNVKHTGSTLAMLRQWGRERYTSEDGYLKKQAVGDKNIVTANGTGYLEFTHESLLALETDTEEKIETFYDFSKNRPVRWQHVHQAYGTT